MHDDVILMINYYFLSTHITEHSWHRGLKTTFGDLPMRAIVQSISVRRFPKQGVPQIMQKSDHFTVRSIETHDFGDLQFLGNHHTSRTRARRVAEVTNKSIKSILCL